MNKALLAGLVVGLLSSAAHARDVSSGTLMVTGDSNVLGSSSTADFSSGSSSTEDKTKINLASLYYITDNVGIGLVYGREYTKKSDASKVTKDTMNMYGPGAGYNLSLNQDMSILLHAEYLVANGTTNDCVTGSHVELGGHGYQLGTALNYFVNDSVAISLSLLRARESIDIKGTPVSAKYTQTSTSLGMSVFF